MAAGAWSTADHLRDCGGDYASDARQGAPEALPIADRLHLQNNSSDVLERILACGPSALRAAVTDAGVATHGDTSLAAPNDPSAGTEPRRALQLARYGQVIALRQEGWCLTAIAALVGLSRPSVRKYVNAEGFPEWPARRTKLSVGTAHASYLQSRCQEGGQDATVRWHGLSERGFTESLRMVQRVVAGWRVEPPRSGWLTRRPGPPPQPAPPRPRPPSARQAVWLLLRPTENLEPDQLVMRARLLAAAPEIEGALAVIEAFRGMVHDRDATALDDWLQTAAASTVRELRTFAAGIRRDRPAVEAALRCAWSSGQVEGQVCWTKLGKQIIERIYNSSVEY